MADGPRNERRSFPLPSILLALAFTSACGPDYATGVTPATPGATPVVPTTVAGAGDPNAPIDPPAGETPAPPRPAAMFRDEDFLEGDSRRDPFRAFRDLYGAVAAGAKVQRPVLLPTAGVADLRVIAIVSGIASPKATLIDASGEGITVQRGDYVGRAEIVQSGAQGLPVTLNWRVERIRPTEVVLSRDDPSTPNAASLHKIIPLYPEGENPESGPV